MVSIALPKWTKRTKVAKPTRVNYGPWERVLVIDPDDKKWYAQIPHNVIVQYMNGYWGRYQWSDGKVKWLLGIATPLGITIMLYAVLFMTSTFLKVFTGSGIPNVWIYTPIGITAVTVAYFGWNFGKTWMQRKTMWVVRRTRNIGPDGVDYGGKLVPVIQNSALQNYVNENEKIAVRADWLSHLVAATSLKVLRRNMRRNKGLEKLEFTAVILLIVAIIAVCFMFGLASKEDKDNTTGIPGNTEQVDKLPTGPI